MVDFENKMRIPSKNSRVEGNKLTLQTSQITGVLQRRSRLNKFDEEIEVEDFNMRKNMPIH